MKMLLHVTREGSEDSLVQKEPLPTSKQVTQGVLDGRASGNAEKEMNATVNPTQQNDSQDIDSLYDTYQA